MRTLNLATNGHGDEAIKAYLEANVSEILADKINNGTPFTKEGKTFINRKDLTGFMKYATEEARKLSSKGARGAYVDDPTVFGWAIHYFEEDSIEGTLYTLDGEPYKPTPKATHKPTPKPTPAKPLSAQQSMFDLLTSEGEPEDEIEEDTTEAEVVTVSESEPPKRQGSPLYLRYLDYKDQYPDAIIAMRVGDFYEIFGEDAIVVANKLELTLTGRDCGFDTRVPMVGFPYHVQDTYVNKIAEIKAVVLAEEESVRYYSAPNSQVDIETGEVKTQKVYFEDEGLIRLLRILDKAEARL